MEKKKETMHEPVQGVDYLVDSLERLVFSREYLLKRGRCCENDCRHCPYKSDLKVLPIS